MHVTCRTGGCRRAGLDVLPLPGGCPVCGGLLVRRFVPGPELTR